MENKVFLELFFQAENKYPEPPFFTSVTNEQYITCDPVTPLFAHCALGAGGGAKSVVTVTECHRCLTTSIFTSPEDVTTSLVDVLTSGRGNIKIREKFSCKTPLYHCEVQLEIIPTTTLQSESHTHWFVSLCPSITNYNFWTI